MHRKKFSIHKAFTVLLLTIIIFSVGIIVGNQTSYHKMNTVIDLGEQLQLETRSIEAQYDILENNICLNENVLFLTKDLFDLAEKIDFMENTLGSQNAQVQELKKQYFVVEAKHWLLAKKRADQCFENNITINNTVVLYFYSNKGDCPQCQQQGAVISYLHKEYEGMLVYSFDSNSDSVVVQTLKDLYDIKSEMPSLVINGETHKGFLDSDEFIGFVTTQQAKNNITENNTTVNQTNSSVN